MVRVVMATDVLAVPGYLRAGPETDQRTHWVPGQRTRAEPVLDVVAVGVSHLSSILCRPFCVDKRPSCFTPGRKSAGSGSRSKLPHPGIHVRKGNPHREQPGDSREKPSQTHKNHLNTTKM